ncbi:MAG: PD-(D/E)XK nuclease family protein [Acidobacteria bacterium]|nr:PD-(D/E)XK nuclease family protein [Acidobacteriota bacterium]
MGSRLLLTGRAGSGKTHAILQRLMQLARNNRLGEVLLLLPTQSQVDHLRGVLLRECATAFRDDFAHTFFTFSRALSKAPEQLLPEVGKDYLLGEVLRLESLPSFDRVRETRGFRALLGGAIKELKQNAVLPEHYQRRILESLEGMDGVRPRHRDLGKALFAYQQRLAASGRIDQEDLELMALKSLESDPGLPEGKSVLLVDGFHDFTGVQLGILALLARRCSEAIFTLSFDEARPASPVFEASKATRENLLKIGLEVREMRGNRRSADPTLRRLEEGLFGNAAGLVEAGASLKLLRCARREDEVESIARRIVRLVREEGVPYRDIAVLYHDLGEAADLLEGTFRRFGIPLRIYQPRALDRHPLAGFLLDLGRTLAEGPKRETILRLLRSGYIEGLGLEEVDRLDQRIREQGAPSSGREWTDFGDDLQLPGIARWLRRLRARGERIRGKHTHDALASAWIGCFEEVALPLGEQGEDGPSECAVYREFIELLESSKVLHDGGKAQITLGRLVEVIQEGAAYATFRLQDRRREVVNAINAYEARQWEVPYLFVAGVLERQFPPAPLEDLFFNDEARRALNARGLRFPDREWRQSEERFLFYMAVTRARRRLHLSHARSDSQEAPTLASFFLREVEKLFTPESLKSCVTQRSPSEVLPVPDEMVSLDDVDRAIFQALEERILKGRIPPRIALAAALYQRRRGDPEFLARLHAALSETRPALTDAALLQDIAQRQTAFSNSALTAFLQCPYLHFAQKWMRLEALPEPQVGAVDLGQVLHGTLKDYFEGGAAGDPLVLLDRHFEQRTRARAITFRRRTDYWRLRAALVEILEAEKRRSARLRPSRFEVPFGLERESSHPAVPILSAGREEKLSGIIDRIDTDSDGKLGYVVDYKYSDPSRVRDQFKASVSGDLTNFQPAIYLLALREALGLEPVGAELLAAKTGVQRFAVGRESLEEVWGAPEKSERLGEADFEGFLGRARTVMADLIASARTGDIDTRPKDPEACGPGACDAADVCRYDRWLGGKYKGD